MHIQPSNENLSFKKIQLKKAEKDAVFSILKEVSTTTSTDKINRLREHLLSIYNDYLQKESLKYSFSYVHSSDFLQSLYLKFLSLFESIKKGEILPEEFVSELSDSKVEKNDTKRSALSIEQPLRKNKKSCIKNTITENDLPLPYREKTESEIKTIKNELYSLTEDVALNPKEISSFTGIGAGKSFKTLIEEFNASDYSIRRHLTSAIAKIQQKHNLLPEEFDAFVTDIIKKYNINKSKEDVINKLVKNAYDFSHN